MEEQKQHFLLVAYPAQGHINPALQFAKRLLGTGANVTFATTVSAHQCFLKARVPEGMTIATFSDGYDDGFKETDGEFMDYSLMLRQCGVMTLTEIIEKSVVEEKQVTCLVYTLTLPWVAEVARKFNVPCALLWVQPALMFTIFYYYFNGYHEFINDCEKDPSWSLKLPNMPFEFKASDLPSFLLPSNPYLFKFAFPTFQEQVQQLEKEENPIILVNSFEALEVHAMKSIDRFKLIPIGPLLSSAFLGDLSQRSKETDYVEWLNSQEKHSVIYVSFGSNVMLSKLQMEELARALIQIHRPLLWVIREKNSYEQEEEEEEEEEELSCMEELKQQGLIVPWCSQVEVLSHPSVGCFVTHCGWNSTLESLTCGVPMVGFPQWADQPTNSKLVEDVWKIGVRVKVMSDEEQDGNFVKSEEILRCLEEVMESVEMRKNAKKWKELAVEAAKEGGSSYINLKTFMEELVVQC